MNEKVKHHIVYVESDNNRSFAKFGTKEAALFATHSRMVDPTEAENWVFGAVYDPEDSEIVAIFHKDLDADDRDEFGIVRSETMCGYHRYVLTHMFNDLIALNDGYDIPVPPLFMSDCDGNGSHLYRLS